jgi:hypothetical protein
LSFQELREGFNDESEKTGNPRLILSALVSAFPDDVDKGYDIPVLNQ